jgi:hypothetical protein
VHDAIFFKRKLGLGYQARVRVNYARAFVNNPYWHLTAKQLERYQPKNLDA